VLETYRQTMQMLRTVQGRIVEMEERGASDEGFLHAEGDSSAFVDEDEGRKEEQNEEGRDEVDEQGDSNSEAPDSDNNK
jgi:hypothetical protein